jgi:hypothetical protein
LHLSGNQFQGLSEATSGALNGSATNYPLVQLRRLDNDQWQWLQPDPAMPWSNVSFSSLPLKNLPVGQALLTVFTNGIPSVARLLQINSNLSLSAATAQTATQGLEQFFTLGTFVDPGTVGPWTVSVVWGDGSVVTRFVSPTAGALSAQPHIYPDIGDYTVYVTLSDSNGGVTTASFPVTVLLPTALDPVIEPQPSHLIFFPWISGNSITRP